MTLSSFPTLITFFLNNSICKALCTSLIKQSKEQISKLATQENKTGDKMQ